MVDEPAVEPDLLDGAGLALWRKLAAEYEFDPHETVLAVELCRTVRLCEQLQERLAADGLVVDGQRGPKMHPAVAELARQRLVVARLTASLGIPSADDEKPAQKPRGAVRGTYALKVAGS